MTIALEIETHLNEELKDVNSKIKMNSLEAAEALLFIINNKTTKDLDNFGLKNMNKEKL